MQQKIAKPVLAELVRRGWTGGGFACSALNASDRPQTIIMDLRDPIGRSVFGEPGTSTIPPWQTISAGFGFGGTTQAYCTVPSAVPLPRKETSNSGFARRALTAIVSRP
jgi:hypothetical protein